MISLQLYYNYLKLTKSITGIFIEKPNNYFTIFITLSSKGLSTKALIDLSGQRV